MTETKRDYEVERRLAIIEEAAKAGILELTEDELMFIDAEINYYEACMSSSMDMMAVHEYKEASIAFDALPISAERHFAIIRFLNKILDPTD